MAIEENLKIVNGTDIVAPNGNLVAEIKEQSFYTRAMVASVRMLQVLRDVQASGQLHDVAPYEGSTAQDIDELIAFVNQGQELSAQEPHQKQEVPLADKLRDQFGQWGEHPEYPVSNWQHEVGNDDERLGYWPYVAKQIEQAADDEEYSSFSP